MPTIDLATDALIVVDLQHDFCPGGALPVPAGDEVIPVIGGLLSRFQHVVATQDWHPAGHKSFASSNPGRKPFDSIPWRGGMQTLWPDHCVQGTRGAGFVSGFDTRGVRLVVRKGMDPEIDSYSSFCDNEGGRSTGLAGALHELGVRRVFLAGLALDYCVLYSARDARKAGFEAVVLHDACRGIDLHGSVKAALDDMARLGVGVASSGDLA